MNSLTFKCHKVMRQQNTGAVEDFILPYSADYLRIQQWKNYWNRSTFAKVIVKIKVAPFLWPTVYNEMRYINLRFTYLLTYLLTYYLLKCEPILHWISVLPPPPPNNCDPAPHGVYVKFIYDWFYTFYLHEQLAYRTWTHIHRRKRFMKAKSPAMLTELWKYLH